MSNLTPNNNPSLQNPYPDDEIDLKELFNVLWGGRWLISTVTGIATAISVVVALSLPNIYTASALLAPAESSGGGLSGLMKQYGSLASLAGVSLPDSEEGSRALLGMQLMRSRAFIGNFVEHRDILPELMAVEAWDARSGEIIFDPDVYQEADGKWVRDVNFPKLPKPSLLQAYEEFMRILRVSEDKQTGFITVTLDHQSPVIAAEWINWLVEDVNAEVKEQDVVEAESSIQYLQEQIAKTSLTELQIVFYELIQSQMETIMLAEVRPEYVFRTIDPALIPEEKSKPGRALICILGTSLGGFLGVVLVLLRYYTRRSGA